MKKIRLFLTFSFFLASCILLSACQKTELTAEELQKSFHQANQSRLENITKTLTPFSTEQTPTLHSVSQTIFSFPESSLKGGGILNIQKIISNQKEKADITLDVDRQSTDKKINKEEKSLSLAIETLSANQNMYGQIHDFDIFLWEGNYQAMTLNLVLKQIRDKRIDLSSNQSIEISIFNTPRYDEIAQIITSLFFTDFSPQRKKTKNDTYRWEILELPTTYTLQMQEIMRLLAPFGIYIDQSEFVWAPEMDNEILLSPKGKEIRLTFKSYNQFIPVTLLLTKEQLEIHISVVSSEDETYPTLSLTLSPKNAKTYTFTGELRKLHNSPKEPPERTINGKFQLAEKNGILNTTYNILMQITSLALADDQKLNIAIQWTETLQATWADNIDLNEPTETIPLDNLFN